MPREVSNKRCCFIRRINLHRTLISRSLTLVGRKNRCTFHEQVVPRNIWMHILCELLSNFSVPYLVSWKESKPLLNENSSGLLADQWVLNFLSNHATCFGKINGLLGINLNSTLICTLKSVLNARCCGETSKSSHGTRRV